jgi:hypothetical protein
MRVGMRFRFGPFWVSTGSKGRPREVNPNVALFFVVLAVVLAIIVAVWSTVG